METNFHPLNVDEIENTGKDKVKEIRIIPPYQKILFPKQPKGGACVSS